MLPVDVVIIFEWVKDVSLLNKLCLAERIMLPVDVVIIFEWVKDVSLLISNKGRVAALTVDVVSSMGVLSSR